MPPIIKKEVHQNKAFQRMPASVQQRVSGIEQFRRRGANPAKISMIGLMFNVVALVVLILLFLGQSTGDPLPRWVLIFAIVLGILETILAIQSLGGMLQMFKLQKGMERSLDEMETLNRSMRAQRHDFKNHLQVISALLDMDEVQEARDYLDDVSDDFHILSLAMRTSQPAVNAMLQAKQAICREAGVNFEMEITTTLSHLPIEPWEFCRVLGNLIDNAVEALGEAATPNPSVIVHLSEDGPFYCAEVDNNGPPIPEKDRYRIFKPGYSTKGENRGLGLAIVHKLIINGGGSIDVISQPELTSFHITLPKAVPAEEAEG